MVFSADHMNDPVAINKLYEQEVVSSGRRDTLLNFPWNHDIILHEAGIPPIHTPMETLVALPEEVKAKLYGKYSKRRRSNVAVIIVRIVFISPFFFYCLLLNHSFPTNPNRITNCFKLILSVTTLQLHCSCVAILIFEQLFIRIPKKYRKGVV